MYANNLKIKRVLDHYFSPKMQTAQKLFASSWVPFFLSGVTGIAFGNEIGTGAYVTGTILTVLGAVMFIIASSKKE